ncbi:hypothetical protein HYC85_028468 [Camellia sinensis]|uniref:Uncharacterized protein n=1 Tax=Camellia sinensis TaxID=4442 RepID=A0A7J7FW06_CAMSI|nr:hypothetical protein HYC85_028468 [Camellia sinensis]
MLGRGQTVQDQTEHTFGPEVPTMLGQGQIVQKTFRYKSQTTSDCKFKRKIPSSNKGTDGLIASNKEKKRKKKNCLGKYRERTCQGDRATVHQNKRKSKKQKLQIFPEKTSAFINRENLRSSVHDLVQVVLGRKSSGSFNFLRNESYLNHVSRGFSL